MLLSAREAAKQFTELVTSTKKSLWAVGLQEIPAISRLEKAVQTISALADSLDAIRIQLSKLKAHSETVGSPEHNKDAEIFDRDILMDQVSNLGSHK
jgi:hypothetical protein